jgi:hypothetical protein
MAFKCIDDLSVAHQSLHDVEMTSSLHAVKPEELSDEVKLLVQQLEENTIDSPHHWGWFHLEIENLSLQECQAIVEGMKVNTNVEWLEIKPRDNEFKDYSEATVKDISLECLSCIVGSLKTNTHITQLYLHADEKDNYLIPVPTQTLVEVLKVNKSINELTIQNSSITDDDVKTIADDGLKMNTTVTNFHLENNPRLTVQSAHYLSKLIESTEILKNIWFEGKPSIDDEWAVLIASALKVNRSIEKVIMNHSQIGDEGAKAFAEMLAVNQTLKNLMLFNNQITDVGAKALADGLKHNTTLESLSIDANQFFKTSEGGKALLKAKSAKLTYLDLK